MMSVIRIGMMVFLVLFLANPELVAADAVADKQEGTATKNESHVMKEFRESVKGVERFITRVGAEIGKVIGKTRDAMDNGMKESPKEEKK